MVDADIDMPPSFSRTIAERVVCGRQVFAPIVFSLKRGQSKDKLLATSTLRDPPLRTGQRQARFILEHILLRRVCC